MNRKRIPAYLAAASLSGIVFITIGMRQVSPPHAAVNVRQSINDAEEAPAVELARWLLREGRARLRSGRLDSAEDASVIAQVLDPASSARDLYRDALRRRERIVEGLGFEVQDAMDAGNGRRLSRIESVIGRMTKRGEDEKNQTESGGLRKGE